MAAYRQARPVASAPGYGDWSGLVGFGFLAPPTEITVKAIVVKVAQKGELGGQKETARLMAR